MSERDEHKKSPSLIGLVVRLGDGKELHISTEDARCLYEVLHEMFGDKTTWYYGTIWGKPYWRWLEGNTCTSGDHMWNRNITLTSGYIAED